MEVTPPRPAPLAAPISMHAANTQAVEHTVLRACNYSARWNDTIVTQCVAHPFFITGKQKTIDLAQSISRCGSSLRVLDRFYTIPGHARGCRLYGCRCRNRVNAWRRLQKRHAGMRTTEPRETSQSSCAASCRSFALVAVPCARRVAGSSLFSEAC